MEKRESYTTEEIEILQNNFRKITDNAKTSAAFFYNRLIEMGDFEKVMNPCFSEFTMEYLAIIGEGMQCVISQGAGSDALPKTRALLTSLELTDDDYNTIGAVFIDMLRHTVGDEFSAKMLNVWVRVYRQVLAELV